MKKNIFVVLLIIAAVFAIVIPAMSFAPSKNEDGAVGDADTVQENNNVDDEENAGVVDGLEVSQLTAIITPYNDDNSGTSHSSWELTVTLENGNILTKYYDYGNYYIRDPELYYADLNDDGSDEIVLIMPNATSNYVASNIHVLRVDKDVLTEILTILDSPQEEYLNDYKDNYKDSLFIIPHIANDEELPPYTPESYETFCTGAEIVQTSEGAELWIRHIMKDSIPYSIIRWNGVGWYVAEQGINLSPNSIEDDQTEVFQKNESITLNFREERFDQNITMINESAVAETYLEYYFEDSKFIIFKNAYDNENAHSGVVIDKMVYDLGEVSTLFQADQCTITTTDIYGVTLVKITGVLGAAYAPSEYYCIDSSENEKHPRRVLRIENYNNIEVDLDKDGTREIFEWSMTASLLHRYDADSQKFYVADLIADTGAMQVVMDEKNLFTAYIEHGEVYGTYLYSDRRLIYLTPTDITMGFIQGNWVIKSFLGFNISTKHDPEDIQPYCEKLIGKALTITSALFDSTSVDINKKFFSACAVKTKNVDYKVDSIFSGKDSALNLYRYYKLENEVIKTADDDEIKGIGVYYEKGGDFIPDLRLLAVNNNRLLLRLSDGYFELERITPEYNSIGELGSDGLTDNQVYTFRDGDITINHYTQALLMIDGRFTSKAAAIIKDEHLLVPLRFISEYFGAKVDWISNEQKVIIVYDDTQIEVRLNSRETKINDRVITLGMLPFIHGGRTYVDSDFISEALGIKTGYLPATYKATDISLAYDAVVWVDSTAHTYNEINAKTELRDMLKNKLLNGLENYIMLNERGMFSKEVTDASAHIKTDIENVKYMGQVGRYALFYSPYIILVDTLTNDIFFYKPINAGGVLHKADFNSPTLFDMGYIAG